MDLPEDYTVIDFETKDPYIGEHGYGSGWVFPLNYDYCNDFKVLGLGYQTVRKGVPIAKGYITDIQEMIALLRNNNTFVCHNAEYDIGCMWVLLKEEMDFSSIMVYDTVVLAKLVNSSIGSYSLENCGKRFRLNMRKDAESLLDYAWTSGFIQEYLLETKGITRKVRPSDTEIKKIVMKNLDLLPVEVVGKYCMSDVYATNALFQYCLSKLDNKVDLKLFDDLLEVVMVTRKKGCRVDLKATIELQKEFKCEVDKFHLDFYQEFGYNINLNSTPQLAKFLLDIGIKGIPHTAKGGYSVKNEYLATLPNEWVQRLRNTRIKDKMIGSFLEKILAYQNVFKEDKDKGRIHASLKILGAATTGRFTSGGGSKSNELSIHQIPNTSTDIGKRIRSIFLPEEGEQWVCADYSNQEPRIQVHYAKQLQCPKVDDIIKIWLKDLSLSFHSEVGKLTDLEKAQAKVINLQIAYGAKPGTIAEQLGNAFDMETFVNERGELVTWKKAYRDTLDILDQYHKLLPFMGDLQVKVNKFFKQHRYITTIGGRKLRAGRSCYASCYKSGSCFICKNGLNYLSQGSGADITMKALVSAYKAGLHILNSVHDEINISTKDPERDMKILTDCMVNAYDTVVPMYIEIERGNSWGEAK